MSSLLLVCLTRQIIFRFISNKILYRDSLSSKIFPNVFFFYMQRGVIEAAKEMINEGISANLDLIKSPCFNNKFHIADLGCSIGPNTFIAIQNIIDTVQKKYQDENHNPLDLEFQVFFNDQVNNDFNTLFKALPPSRSYFAAGVPGSFHGVLFPNSSLHLVHSSYALHWLSQLPKELVDSKSPAWNKGSIFCSGLVKEVAEVYACQYKKDMNRILNARAQELVPGGLIIILESSLPDDVPMSHTAMGMPYDFLGSCLHDMVKMVRKLSALVLFIDLVIVKTFTGSLNSRNIYFFDISKKFPLPF